MKFNYIFLFILILSISSLKNTFASKKMQLEIITFGKIEDFVLEYLKEKLTEVFSVQVYIGSSFDLPEYAYNKKRNQYLATLILDKINPSSKEKKILAIIDKDLYAPELNFIFGQADPQKGVCIISLIRLHQAYYGLKENQDLFLLRSLKEAVHEIGHLLGLGHCPNPKCVMHFSNSLLDTDKKDYQFCASCKKKIDE